MGLSDGMMRKMDEVEGGAAYPKAAVAGENPRVTQVQVVRVLPPQSRLWARTLIRVLHGQFRIFFYQSISHVKVRE
jgi:hypothetical protein